MIDPKQYIIPVPKWFRAPSLVKLPWSMSTVSALKAGADDAVAQLTEKIKAAYGVKHCILTDSARSAYAIYVRGTKLDGEIVIQSMMHTPTAVLLSNHGLELAFCDIDRDFCTSVEHIEAAASDKTRAVMVTHMFGRVAPIDVIAQWAEERSIKLLSNMVHMCGNVKVNDRPVASYGDVAFLSFNMDKPLNGIYGGALLTNSDEVYEQCQAISLAETPTANVEKMIRRYLMLYRYKEWTGPFQYLYYSMRGEYYGRDDVPVSFARYKADHYQNFSPKAIHPWQAAFAKKLLEQSPETMQGRYERGQQANRLFADVEGATVPTEGDYPNTFHYYPVLFADDIPRYDLGVALAHAGYEAKWRYFPLHLQEKFAHCRKADLSNTESMWGNFLLMPVPYSSAAQIEQLVAATKRCIAKVKR